MGNEFFQAAREMEEALSQWRREIHAHPELGMEERRTARLVARVLSEGGIPVREGCSETGVVGLIGGKEGRTVALRADMDALPIEEETGAPYQSQVPGIMHACGHDGHTAMLLGAARILKRFSLPGNIKVIFQPAEEQSLIGRGGARQMVAEGVLESVSAIAALHLDPDLPAGSIAVRAGVTTASASTFEIEIRGRRAHGAKPQKGVDAVYLAAQAVLAIQGLVARETDALDPKIVTVGEIHGGVSPNILASSVKLRGTLRTLSVEARNTMQQMMGGRIRSLAQALGGKAALSFQDLYPPLVNDPRLTEQVREVGRKNPEVKGIKELATPDLGGEDFAFYAEKVPGVMFRLGCGSPGRRAALHTSTFDFEESVLPLGAGLLAALAAKMLEE